MKLKLVDGPDGKKYAALDDKGLPVYVYEDGRELGFDAPGTVTRLAGLNREAQTHREALESAQASLKRFEGIEDPEAARNAVTTVKNLKAGELKTAEQVAEITREAQRAAELQVQQTAQQSANRIKELEEGLNTRTAELYDEKVGGSFARSKFVSERCVTPPDMLRAMFGKNFKVENGQVVPYGADGNKIFSQVNAGQVADFDEGLAYLINAYPHRAQVLRGTGSSGTGAPHAQQGSTQNGKPTMGRSAFEKLDGAAKHATVKTHAIVDDAAA